MTGLSAPPVPADSAAAVRYDCLIIGAGPAGLSVASSLIGRGYTCRVIEQGPVGNHIAQFPTFMRFFSTRELLELDRFPLTIVDEKPTRVEYLAYLSRFVRDRQLPVEAYTRVTQVEREPNGFRLTVAPLNGPVGQRCGRSLVVACGAFENPRRLLVPGEDLPKVHHRYTEPHPYVGMRVLVVGGRNSAVETALTLWRAGAQVTLVNRRAAFTGHDLKYWLKPDIENRIAKKEITGFMAHTVVRIDPTSVTLQDAAGRQFAVENDFVIPLIGYDPPVRFLQSMGITVAAETNVPVHDPATLETGVPNLFVAGTITAGNVSGHVFIENSRGHGDRIAAALERKFAPARVAGAASPSGSPRG